MNLREMNNVLENLCEKQIKIKLPTGEYLSSHFHITECAYVKKEFMDCGGTSRSSAYLCLQTWVADDFTHAMTKTKLLSIANCHNNILHGALPIYFEVQRDTISLYKLKSLNLLEFIVVLNLENVHTDCLAKDKCGIESNCSTGCC